MLKVSQRDGLKKKRCSTRCELWVNIGIIGLPHVRNGRTLLGHSDLPVPSLPVHLGSSDEVFEHG